MTLAGFAEPSRDLHQPPHVIEVLGSSSLVSVGWGCILETPSRTVLCPLCTDPFSCPAFSGRVVWKLPKCEGGDLGRGLALWGPAALTVTGTMAEPPPPTLLSGGARQIPKGEFHISMKDVILCQHPMATQPLAAQWSFALGAQGRLPRALNQKPL